MILNQKSIQSILRSETWSTILSWCRNMMCKLKNEARAALIKQRFLNTLFKKFQHHLELMKWKLGELLKKDLKMY